METTVNNKGNAKKEKLTLLVGIHKVVLNSNLTTLKNVKSVVGAFIKNYELNPKDTKITLPNKTVLAVRDLDNARNFAKILFPAQYLDASESKENKEFMEVMGKVQAELYSLPIDWNFVGVKDSKQILSQYKKATQKAIEGGKITTDQTKLIA
jgi:hypothetical protein